MSDFTPISGVWYIDPEAVVEGWSIENYDYDLLIAYMPKNDQWPWYSPADHDFLSEDERLRCWPELVEVYNPHPPTRTEWGIKHLEHDCPSEHMGRVTSYGDSRQLMNEEFPNDGHYVRVARQVTETEWQEVDQ